MTYPTIIRVALGLAIPILIAFGISHLVLRRLATKGTKRAAAFQALRLPTMILGWLIGIHIATLVLRVEAASLFGRVDWDAIDIWIKSLATLDIFFIIYRAAVFGLKVATHFTQASSAVLIRKLLAAVLSAIAVITVLDQFSIDIGPVLASLGVAGLAVALALQDTLSNYFAGIIIAVDKPFRPGDFIQIEGGLEGYVQSIGWRTTRIQPFGETQVVVPNNKLANTTLTNTFYPDPDVRVYVECGVSYECDLQHVEQVTLEVARNIQQTAEGADPDFEPVVLFHTFADSNVNFKVVLRAFSIASSGGLRSSFIKALHSRYAAEGIEMSYQVRKVIHIDGNERDEDRPTQISEGPERSPTVDAD